MDPRMMPQRKLDLVCYNINSIVIYFHESNENILKMSMWYKPDNPDTQVQSRYILNDPFVFVTVSMYTTLVQSILNLVVVKEGVYKKCHGKVQTVQPILKRHSVIGG